MEIEISDNKLKAALEDPRLCQRRFGKDMARYLCNRVSALHAAETLADFWPPKAKPERVHELDGDLKGMFSVDVQQPYRLLFRPMDESSPVPSDQQERWKGIKKIEIVRIEDTHG